MGNLYLVINSGSSSLKFSLYSMPEENIIVNGLIEKIGLKDSSFTLKYNDNKESKNIFVKNHEKAIELMFDLLKEKKYINFISDINGIGHRVLHGGEKYSDSVLIDDEVIKNIDNLTKLGPLHHPKELSGIKAIKESSNISQVAVFDTAFHQTIPKENYMYGVPMEWYKENGVRKYGFHGTSYKYIVNEMKKKLNKDDINLIICHLGSGASVACIKDGKCYDTSMGLTPLDGLLMGTRSGNIDPSIIDYISKERNLSIEQINNILNSKSGFIGLSGVNDQRDLEKLMMLGDENSKLTFNMFVKSIIKYIAEYYFELDGQVDALVFTAGIGENSMFLRECIINKLSKSVNIKLDKIKNDNIARFKDNKEGIITSDDSKFPVYVLPTDEEKMILEDTYKIINKSLKR